MQIATLCIGTALRNRRYLTKLLLVMKTNDHFINCNVPACRRKRAIPNGHFFWQGRAFGKRFLLKSRNKPGMYFFMMRRF